MPNYDEDQLASLREKIAITERDITSCSNRLEQLQNHCLSPDEIRHACRQFDPLWDTLTTNEQWRMLGLLLERVEFDAETESINITFAPGGVKTLNHELSHANLQEATA